MTHHLTHKPKPPWYWDGHDPLDKPVVAQSPVSQLPKPEPTPEPEGWDIDGLGR